eukprot:83751_1
MLSGNKRTGREHDESLPSKKRPKKNTNQTIKDQLNDCWPQKRNLNDKQLKQLPSMMNPSFHKAVLESFWNKKKFGSPSFAMNEMESPTNNKQKLFQCQMTLINKQNKSQQITVTSSAFDSKKKAH